MATKETEGRREDLTWDYEHAVVGVGAIKISIGISQKDTFWGIIWVKEVYDKGVADVQKFSGLEDRL